nr:hypothetical protein [Tanacetum cinerariifolium]
MTSITSLCEMAYQVVQKKLEEKQIKEERAAKAKYWKLPVCYNDDDDEERSDSLNDNIISGLSPFSAITPDEPVLSTEEPDNSLMSPRVFPNMCVMCLLMIILCLSTFQTIKLRISLSLTKNFFSIDDDSFSIDTIDYVEASPPDSELVSSEVMEIVIPEVGGIDDDILLTIKDNILRKKLLNINLLISKIEALNVNPTPSSDCKTKSPSTSLNSFLEETNTFDNSLPEFKTFCFDVEEISSGITTTHPNISLPEYEVFHDDHVKEISSGSPTTHSDSSLYASFIFDLSINPFPPTDRSDFYKYTDELIPFISAPEYGCFLFKVEPNSRDFTKDVVEDISLTKEPQVLTTLPTHPSLQLNIKFQPSSEYLFTCVVWIFLPFLVCLVAPHYLLSLRNEDIIFDPGICKSTFSRPDISHRLKNTKKMTKSDQNQTKTGSSINETPAEKAAKRRKLNEEVEDLKRHLEIVPDEDDDVYTEATPLARKVPFVDYEIIELNNKPYYKIIRADGTHQLYISFLTLLKNFDREDLEALWNLVKEICTCLSLEESKDYTWSSKGQELEATGIMWCAYHNLYNHAANFVSRKKVPLSRFTLDQMLNAIRLQVEEESEVSLELLRFTRQQHQEGQLE